MFTSVESSNYSSLPDYDEILELTHNNYIALYNARMNQTDIYKLNFSSSYLHSADRIISLGKKLTFLTAQG